MTTIWFKEPATNLCPYLEYLTHSQFFRGNWRFVELRPSEVITNSFSPSLKATATDKVRGCVSSEEGWSMGLKRHSQASILSKLVDAMCSYLMAFIFFSDDRIKINFFVGITQISNIFWHSMVEVRIDWMGDLRVYTRVSCRSRLNTTGKVFPGGRLWSCIFCFGTLIYPFSLRY